MKAIKKRVNSSPFVPDFTAKSIMDIDFELLAKQGIRYVAFDADSTLVPFWGVQLDPETCEFLKSKKYLFKDWCIASNRVTHDLYELASSIEAGIVQAGLRVRKPRRSFFKRVLHHFDNAKSKHVVMIGDKLLADIWGANRSGFATVWVQYLGSDNILDRIIQLRRIERWLLKRYGK